MRTTDGDPESTAIDFAEILAGEVISHNARLLEGLPWRTIAACVESLEVEHSVEGLAAQALASLEPLVPFDFAFSVVTNRTDIRRTRLFLHRHAPSRLLEEYFGCYVAVDPAIDRIPFTLRGEVNWGNVESVFARDFLARYGVSQSVFISNLARSDMQGFVLVLHRAGRSRFAEREEATLGALLPHLHNLYSSLLEPERTWREGLSRLTWKAGLTPRESEVSGLLARHYPPADIAERLFISRRTVEKHIEHIYAKMGARDRKGFRARLFEG
jgi:DNA-binding CsgD family transcriptional regulator